MILPIYEEEQPGRLLQHRGRRRRRRHDPRQVPQAPHPAPRQVLGEVLLPAGQPRVPGVRHRGRPDRRLHLLRPALPRGLARARPERRADRLQPQRDEARPVEPALGDRAARPRRSPTATSSPRRTGSAARTTSTASWRSTSTAPASSSTRGATSSASVGPSTERGGASSATSTSTWCGRCATTGSSTATAGPTPTPRSRSPDPDTRRTHPMATTLHHAAAPSSARPARCRPTCSSTARRIARRARARLAAARHRPRGVRRHASSTRPASTSSPAASTRTPTWSCRSAARSPPTRSRPARRPRRGAGRRRSSTSPCSATASGCRTASPPGTPRPAGNCAIDYGFHQIVGGVDDDALDGDARAHRRGHHELQAVHGLPGRLLLATTRQILRAMQVSPRQRRCSR